MDNIIIAITKDTRFECGKKIKKYVIFKHIIVVLNGDVKMETELLNWVLASYKSDESGIILVDNVVKVSEKLQDCFDVAEEMGLNFY